MNPIIFTIIGLVLGIVGFWFTVYRHNLDNSRLVATLRISDQNSINILCVNHGRRKVIVELLQAECGNGKTQTTMFSNHGGTPLNELEKFWIEPRVVESVIGYGDAKQLFVIDSVGKKYPVKDSKKALKIVYAAREKSQKKLVEDIFPPI